MHVDETGWRTRGEGRALWTATTPEATFLQIAEHCNREQFNALIGTAYPGIVVSDRWNGYEPSRPQPAPSVLVAPPARLPPPLRRAGRAEDLRRARPRAHPPGVRRLARLPARAPRPRPARRPRSRRSRPSYASCSKTPAPRAGALAGTGGSPTTCSRSGPRSGPSPPSTASSRPTTPPNARSAHRSSTAKSRSAPKAKTASDSPNARSPPPPPAACNAAHCSPTSANYSPPTPAATHSPRSPEAPGTERLPETSPFAGPSDGHGWA